jgi:uncharacterized protein
MPWTLIVVLIILVPLAAVHFYVWRRLYLALCALTSWDRTILLRISAGVHIWASSLPVAYAISYLAFGREIIPAFAGDSPIIDWIFSYPFWVALVIVLQLFLLFVCMDLLNFVVLRLFPAARIWFNGNKPRIYTVLAVVVIPVSIAVIVIDTGTVRVVERDVALPADFRALSGLRIAQISDVQGDGRTTANDLRKYVERVNALRPDIVFFAGDLVTSGLSYIDSTARVLGGLHSRLGTYAAIGDHDMFSSKAMVLAALEQNGIKVIEDSTISLVINHSSDSVKVGLTAVTYTYMQRPGKEKMSKIAEGTRGAYKVFLVHQPAEDMVQFARDHKYNLLLAGHTHGGGVAIGIPGLFLLAPANIETRYLSGFYELGDLTVSVTNGIGLTLAPIRFNAPAEITIINLR